MLIKSHQSFENDLKYIVGTSKNPGWVFKGSLEKTTNSLHHKELPHCGFLHRVRKLLKTEVF